MKCLFAAVVLFVVVMFASVCGAQEQLVPRLGVDGSQINVYVVVKHLDKVGNDLGEFLYIGKVYEPLDDDNAFGIILVDKFLLKIWSKHVFYQNVTVKYPINQLNNGLYRVAFKTLDGNITGYSIKLTNNVFFSFSTKDPLPIVQENQESLYSQYLTLK